jgi:transposase-like protein
VVKLTDRLSCELVALERLIEAFYWRNANPPRVALEREFRNASSSSVTLAGIVTFTRVQRFKSAGAAQRFLSTHAAIYNTFNVQRHLISRRTMRQFRAAAMDRWDAMTAAA